MKKKSLILLSILFSLFIFEKTFSKGFFIGQMIKGEIEVNKSFKINIEHEKPYGFFILNKNIKTTLSRKEIYKIYKHD